MKPVGAFKSENGLTACVIVTHQRPRFTERGRPSQAGCTDTVGAGIEIEREAAYGAKGFGQERNPIPADGTQIMRFGDGCAASDAQRRKNKIEHTRRRGTNTLAYK